MDARALTSNQRTARRPAAAPVACRREGGFSTIEVIVSVVVLLVGLLAVLTMLTRSMVVTTSNNGRVGATNLARELVEAVRGIDYDTLTPTSLEAALTARGLGSGTPLTIVRRGVTYTLATAVCSLDSPADGIEATPPANVCTPRFAGSTVDPNGDDFRRVTLDISWTESSTTRTLKQTELIVNPSGGLGPRIKTVSPLTQTITNSATSVASVTFTTSAAAAVHWNADDGKSKGDAVLLPGTPNTWGADWALGTSGLGSEVLDGSYQMIAQAFDDRSVAGDAKVASVVLNRSKPYPPPSLAGGYNSRLGLTVDLSWQLSPERDIVGYRVYWTPLFGLVGSQLVCPSSASMLSNTTSSCMDSHPNVDYLTTYGVVALDRDSSGALREGDLRFFTIGPLGLQPAAPRGPLVASTVANQPTLTWNAPVAGSPIFYRIYRGGTTFADRYDRTTGPVTTWSDNTSTVSHDYWITTVDSLYNESAPIGPVRWSP